MRRARHLPALSMFATVALGPCCDTVNRGAVYSNGRIIFNTLDNHTIALNAESGSELWNATLGDINRGVTLTRPSKTSSSAD
jgi:outer membrane protein assembly factor BamB